MAVVYGLLYLLFTTITTVFTRKYHWAPELCGLAVGVYFHLLCLLSITENSGYYSLMLTPRLVHRFRSRFLPRSHSSRSYFRRYRGPHDEGE